MTAKLCTIGILVFTLMFVVACASEAPESATPTPLPPTATPTSLPPTATPTPLPPTATPTTLPPTATSTPRPTATLAPSEVIASQAEDVVGVWKSRYQGVVAYMHFKPDGRFRLSLTVEETNAYIRGRFWFEGTVFHLDDDKCDDPGAYEVWLLKKGDKPIRLTFVKIQDTCLERARDWRTPVLWVEP